MHGEESQPFLRGVSAYAVVFVPAERFDIHAGWRTPRSPCADREVTSLAYWWNAAGNRLH